MGRVENVADHPELIEQIGRWHWDEWGRADPNGSLETWTDGLRERTNRDHIPLTLVAMDSDGHPIGSVTLVEHDMPDRADLRLLTPWVAGTFVVQEERGKGVGSAMMRHAAAEATRMGIHKLSLYTSTARGFYERLGWRSVRHDSYEGSPVTIMTLDLGCDNADLSSGRRGHPA